MKGLPSPTRTTPEVLRFDSTGPYDTVPVRTEKCVNNARNVITPTLRN